MKTEIKQFLDFLKIPGYLIKATSISGISDVNESMEKVKSKEDGKEAEIKTYKIAVYFDGISAQLFFSNKNEAIAIRKEILVVYKHLYEKNHISDDI